LWLQKELREEDRRYRENLRQIYEEEKIRERELEALIQQEVERMWQKRLAQWKLEREARKKLMRDVLAVRAEQVQERRKSGLCFKVMLYSMSYYTVHNL